MAYNIDQRGPFFWVDNVRYFLSREAAEAHVAQEKAKAAEAARRETERVAKRAKDRAERAERLETEWRDALGGRVVMGHPVPGQATVYGPDGSSRYVTVPNFY